MQFVVKEYPGNRFIQPLTLHWDDDKTPVLCRALRILTEDSIRKLSNGSFRKYRKRVMGYRPQVHEQGTPQAIRAIDYLAATCTARYMQEK